MPSAQPRLSVVLDRDLQRNLRLVAKKRGKSLSATAAELLRDALDHDEDVFLARLSKRPDAQIHGHDEACARKPREAKGAK